MEVIPFSSVTVIAYHNNVDGQEVNKKIICNNVAYNVSDFVFPSIFYAFQKSSILQEVISVQNLRVFSSSDSQQISQQNKQDNVVNNKNLKENNSIVDLIENRCDNTFKKLCEDSADQKEFATVLPKLMIRERILINPTYNNYSFLWNKIEARKLLHSIKWTIFKDKMRMSRNAFQEIVKKLFIRQNNNIFKENLTLVPSRSNQTQINLSGSFSSENIENDCDNLYLSEIKTQIQDDVHADNNQFNVSTNEQSFNLNDDILKKPLLNFHISSEINDNISKNNKFEQIVNIENTNENSIQIAIKHEVGEEDDLSISGLEENISILFPEEKNNDVTEIKPVDSWSETNVLKAANNQTEIKISKPATIPKNSNTKILFKKINKPNDGKRKGSTYDFTKDNFENERSFYNNDPKLTKYHYGDKGTNQQYFNVIRSNGNFLCNNFDRNIFSSGQSSNNSNDFEEINNRYFNCNVPRNDFDANYACDNINQLGNQQWTDFGTSRNFKDQNKSAFLVVREQWRQEGNNKPDPHLNLTFRQSTLTRKQIKKIKSIKHPSNILNFNQQRCHLPMNLLNNRINNLQEECQNLEMNMNNFDRQQSFHHFNNFHQQFGPLFQSFDDNRYNNVAPQHQKENLFRKLVQCRDKLGKLNEIQQEIVLMYGDMLLDGNDAMMSDFHENEIREMWARLANYHNIYERKQY